MAPEDDDESTIVRKGKDAFSFMEMGKFVKDLGTRPIGKLLDDMPGLLALSEAKYALVSMALAKRMRVSDDERTMLETKLELLKMKGTPEVRKRCDALLKKPD